MDPVIQLLQPLADSAPDSLNVLLTGGAVLCVYIIALCLRDRAKPKRPESLDTLLAGEGVELIDPNKPKTV